MQVLSLCPWPIGAVRWTDRDRQAALIVKMTFSHDKRGTLSPSEAPEGLEGELPSRFGDDDELERPNDFVPPKRGVDVLVVGSAYAMTPTPMIAAALGVDGLSTSFYACSTAPTKRLPLARAYLRSVADPSAEPLSIGPLRGGVFSENGHGLRLGVLSSSARVVMMGLTGNAALFHATLPGLEPRLFAVSKSGAHALQMTCDTLLVDTDRGTLVLTYRVAAPEDVLETSTLVLTQDLPEERVTWSSVERQLSRAIVVSPMESDDAYAPAPQRVDLAALRGNTLPLDPTEPWVDPPATAVPSTDVIEVDPRLLPSFPEGPTERAPKPWAPSPDTWSINDDAAAGYTMSLDHYVAVRVELEQGGELERVLGRYGLGVAAWCAAQSHWHDRSLKEKEVAVSLRTKLAEARRRGR